MEIVTKTELWRISEQGSNMVFMLLVVTLLYFFGDLFLITFIRDKLKLKYASAIGIVVSVIYTIWALNNIFELSQEYAKCTLTFLGALAVGVLFKEGTPEGKAYIVSSAILIVLVFNELISISVHNDVSTHKFMGASPTGKYEYNIKLYDNLSIDRLRESYDIMDYNSDDGVWIVRDKGWKLDEINNE